MLPIHFAPLQGFTESAYRLAHSKFAPGIHTYYTPFLRLEKGEVRAKDLRDLQTEHPYHLVPQIIVRDVEEFNLLTKTVTDLGFQEIDINMGCPYPMQTKSGRGSGILPHPEKVREMHQFEHDGDEATHAVINTLNETFITPFDREDILANYQVIVSDLDNVIAQHSEQRDARKAELVQGRARLRDLRQVLCRMQAPADF